MRRIFTLLLGALAMVAVALISAFIAMRLAIHGREAVVPPLTGLTVPDASSAAQREGLRLTLESRFYSSGVPAGHILAQDPAAGSHVRRDWPVRITESLGTQRVSIPDLSGESERAATVSIRRLSLELGTVAHLALPGDPDVVLTQTPAANAGEVDSPRVSLLVSDPEDPAQSPAYVMPSLVGLSYAAAAERAAAAGLHLVLAPEAQAAGSPSAATSAGSPSSATGQSASPPSIPQQPASRSTAGVVTAQTPQPGRRVVQGDAVHIALSTVAPAAALAAQ